MTQMRQSVDGLQRGAPRSIPKWKFLLVALALAIGVGSLVSLNPLLAVAFAAATLGLISFLLLAAYRPIWLLYGLVLFMPFENFILKFLPGSDQIYFFARFGTEIIIYIGFAVVVTHHLVTGKPLRRTPVDLPLMFFLGLAAFSVLINRAFTVDTIANLRALLRYVVLFYWIVNLDIEPRQVRRMLQIILLTALLQVGIGALQYLAKGDLDSFLMPRQADIELAGQSRSFRLTSERGREYGAVFGTLGDTVYFGLFLLVALAVYLGRAKRITLPVLFGVGAMAVAIAYSYSRAATFGIAVVLILFVWLRYGSERLMALFLALSLVALVVVGLLLYSPPQEYSNPTRNEQSVVENMAGIFSSDYVNIAQKQRLGTLLRATPAVLTSKPLFGYGPSINQVIETINATHTDFIDRQLRVRGFEDVYWVALLTYYGILGVAAFALVLATMFISAFRTARTTHSRQLRHVAIATACVVGLASFLLFFNSVLEYRIFSFYFWLLPALLYASKAAVTRNNAKSASALLVVDDRPSA